MLLDSFIALQLLAAVRLRHMSCRAFAMTGARSVCAASKHRCDTSCQYLLTTNIQFGNWLRLTVRNPTRLAAPYLCAFADDSWWDNHEALAGELSRCVTCRASSSLRSTRVHIVNFMPIHAPRTTAQASSSSSRSKDSAPAANAATCCMAKKNLTLNSLCNIQQGKIRAWCCTLVARKGNDEKLPRHGRCLGNIEAT